MIFFTETQDILINKKSVITFGKFDGLHRGHQKLIRRLLQVAGDDFLSLVFSFSVSPLQVVTGKEGKQILTNEERKTVMEALGADCFVEYPFTSELMHMSAEAFVENILVKKLGIVHAVIGPDFCFGYKRQGNAALLKELGKKWGFEAEVLEKERIGDDVVSSSRIRKMIEKGDMEECRQLLAYPYFFRGLVVYGKQIGRTLGLPTLNQIPSRKKLLPPKGVYITLTKIGGDYLQGITNVGEKPTVDGSFMGIETHLFDFSGEAYGECVDVFFLSYLRREFKFDSLDALREQIEKDKERAKAYFKDNQDRDWLGILK